MRCDGPSGTDLRSSHFEARQHFGMPLISPRALSLVPRLCPFDGRLLSLPARAFQFLAGGPFRLEPRWPYARIKLFCFWASAR